jgi:hypothetical protein
MVDIACPRDPIELSLLWVVGVQYNITLKPKGVATTHEVRECNLVFIIKSSIVLGNAYYKIPHKLHLKAFIFSICFIWF